MQIKPIRDNILIEPIKKEDKTASGILLPGNSQDKQEQGKIIAVGPGKKEEGKIVPLEVKVGDVVVFTQYGPNEIKVDGKKYLIAKESDILAILEM